MQTGEKVCPICGNNSHTFSIDNENLHFLTDLIRKEEINTVLSMARIVWRSIPDMAKSKTLVDELSKMLIESTQEQLNKILEPMRFFAEEFPRVIEKLPGYLIEAFSRWQVRFERPSIFVRSAPLEYLRYDPWADIEEMKKTGINDLGDIIGSLIPLHKLAIDMVYHKAGTFMLQGKIERNEYLRIILGMITCMGKIQNEVIEWLLASASKVSKLENIIDFDPKVSPGQNWDEDVFARYLSTWFDLLKKGALAGPPVFKNILTLSLYIHGIS